MASSNLLLCVLHSGQEVVTLVWRHVFRDSILHGLNSGGVVRVTGESVRREIGESNRRLRGQPVRRTPKVSALPNPAVGQDHSVDEPDLGAEYDTHEFGQCQHKAPTVRRAVRVVEMVGQLVQHDEFT